jgi:tetratricopeptide (TPR) repeat protein
LEEAGDFASNQSTMESDLQVSGFVAGHRTPVLKKLDSSAMNPLMAMQAYYEYAVPQLARAGNRESVAAAALYGLGRVSMQMASVADGRGNHGPTPIALFQAALAIDDQNADAANELGVLLARYGQLEQAESYLKQSMAVRPTNAAVNNLAEVRRRLGWTVAQPGERQLAAVAPSDPSSSIDPQRVNWVDPKTFVQSGRGRQTAGIWPESAAVQPQNTRRASNAMPANTMSSMWPMHQHNRANDRASAQAASNWGGPETQRTKPSGFGNWFF